MFAFSLQLQLQLGLSSGVLNKCRQFARTSCDLHFNFVNFATKISLVATWDTMLLLLLLLLFIEAFDELQLAVCLWSVCTMHTRAGQLIFKLVAKRFGATLDLQLTPFFCFGHVSQIARANKS